MSTKRSCPVVRWLLTSIFRSSFPPDAGIESRTVISMLPMLTMGNEFSMNSQSPGAQGPEPSTLSHRTSVSLVSCARGGGKIHHARERRKRLGLCGLPRIAVRRTWSNCAKQKFNFREQALCEVRRIHLLRDWVNKGEKEGLGYVAWAFSAKVGIRKHVCLLLANAGRSLWRI